MIQPVPAVPVIAGERIGGLWVEFPSNPLLRSPDLQRAHLAPALLYYYYSTSMGTAARAQLHTK